MNLKSFRTLLAEHPNAGIQFLLPGNQSVPAHFHVTEVAHVRKDFIDCGGTVRSESSCVLQVWVADDVEHRLETSKLSRILKAAEALLPSDEISVQVEYQGETISRYNLADSEESPSSILLTLKPINTGCLAPDRCGVNPLPVLSCGPSGCC